MEKCQSKNAVFLANILIYVPLLSSAIQINYKKLIQFMITNISYPFHEAQLSIISSGHNISQDAHRSPVSQEISDRLLNHIPTEPYESSPHSHKIDLFKIHLNSIILPVQFLSSLQV
jgi:hypothetical protein